jgi:tetratricopeptide (TPR) repeat protein
MQQATVLTLVIAAFVLWRVVAIWRIRRVMLPAINAVMEPHRRGDYEAALQASECLRRGGEVTAAYCFYRGANLAHLGRLEEAEVWLRRNIAMRDEKKERRHLAIGFTTLGHLMLQAGRFEEAQECFETSMRHFPGRGSGYRSMAELCLLLRRDSPAEALRWANLAIRHAQADREISGELRKMNLGEDLATLAWATAADSRSASEVARLVAEAVASVGTSNIQSTAQVHYLSGCAYAEIGDLRNSAQHYEEAARLDLQGHWGRAANAALRSSRQQKTDNGA